MLTIKNQKSKIKNVGVSSQWSVELQRRVYCAGLFSHGNREHRHERTGGKTEEQTKANPNGDVQRFVRADRTKARLRVLDDFHSEGLACAIGGHIQSGRPLDHFAGFIVIRL